MKKTLQPSESHALGLLLALAGGFLDAYTYLCRGHVFANAQTGNIVLLGLHLIQLNWKKTILYLMPVLAFILGILICEGIQTRCKWNKNLHWRQLIILLEIIILSSAAFLPVGPLNTLVNIMVSFVCALQVEAFRKMNGNTYATTMCTGNLRSATEQLYLYTRTRDRACLHSGLQYYNVILFFILGAMAGAVATNFLGRYAVLLSTAGLAAAFFYMNQKTENSNE